LEKSFYFQKGSGKKKDKRIDILILQANEQGFYNKYKFREYVTFHQKKFGWG